MRRSIYICLMAAVLAGCAAGGSSINRNRFTMVTDVSAAAYTNPFPFNIQMDSVLRSGSIVLRTSDVTTRPAQHHRWGVDLQKQLELILTDAFLKQGRRPKGLLRVDVSRFEGDLEGNVVLQAAVSLDKDRIHVKSYFYRGKSAQEGYEALVREMRAGWEQLSGEIAADWVERK